MRTAVPVRDAFGGDKIGHVTKTFSKNVLFHDNKKEDEKKEKKKKKLLLEFEDNSFPRSESKNRTRMKSVEKFFSRRRDVNYLYVYTPIYKARAEA